MTRINIAPFRDFDSIGKRIQDMFDRFPSGWDWNGFSIPIVDVYEDNVHVYVDAELPGMRKEDVKITIQKGVLTLKGERQLPEEDHDRKFLRRERSSGSFTRSFTLPVEVNVNNIEASFNNGVLHISLPKSNPKDIERSIEIR